MTILLRNVKVILVLGFKYTENQELFRILFAMYSLVLDRGLAEHRGLFHFEIYSILLLIGIILILCYRNYYFVGPV